jgi:hypothetical protein
MDRLQLQQDLEDLLGSENVYFQPPSTVKMQYPAIVYNRDQMDTAFADNAPYMVKERYQVTVIDRNPDSVIPEKIAYLPLSTFVSAFVADNLNHSVFALYY